MSSERLMYVQFASCAQGVYAMLHEKDSITELINLAHLMKVGEIFSRVTLPLSNMREFKGSPLNTSN